MTWATYYPVEGGEYAHYVPEFGRAHLLDPECWCEPEPHPEEPHMLIHHQDH